MAEFADCLAGFAAALGLDRPVVGGLSFGGALAWRSIAGTQPCQRR